MSERKPPSRSRRAGNRGAHRHIDSPETEAFHELERDPRSILNMQPEPKAKKKKTRDRHGIRVLGAAVAQEAAEPMTEPGLGQKPKKRKLKPAPARPPWMDAAEYAALLELREGLG